MKKEGLVYLIAGVVFGGLLIFIVFIIVSKNQGSNIKTGYIVQQTLFDEFQGTIELRKKLKNMENEQKHLIDSLSLELELLSKQKDPKSKLLYSRKSQEYMQYYKQLMADNSETVRSYEADVWKQINQYVADYGHDKKYTYIFGASGSGNIMHADSTNNLTKEILVYVNQRYGGK